MGPLKGIKAIEMAGIGFGPFCAMMLVDMGAEVVLIDRPNSKGSKFEVMNRGKRSIAFDLKIPDGGRDFCKQAEWQTKASMVSAELNPQITG